MSAEAAPISAKLGGVLAMFGSVAMLFVLPWLDTHPVRSARYRPLYKLCFLLLVVIFLVLGTDDPEGAGRRAPDVAVHPLAAVAACADARGGAQGRRAQP